MYELSNKPGQLEIGASRKKFLKKVVILPLLILAVAGSAVAADRVNKDEDPAIFEDLKTQLSFSSPLEAYRQGKTAFDEGWYSLALPAIQFAAKRGVFGARLILAKMYERGLGVPVDSAAAFDLYKNISKKHWNISSYHPAAPYIGSSLASLGLYYLDGITAIGLKPDAKRAATYFTHASQFFGNARAQYQLGKLYLSGHGVKKNVRRAISWLNNAAKKKHAPSQALLGQLLWEGDLVPKRQIKALALLIMAQKNAGPRDSEWINELHKTIVAASDLENSQRGQDSCCPLGAHTTSLVSIDQARHHPQGSSHWHRRRWKPFYSPERRSIKRREAVAGTRIIQMRRAPVRSSRSGGSDLKGRAPVDRSWLASGKSILIKKQF